ncbi:3-dehydroquinate synthase [Halpernia frigidisoli]|uniref:3-dehydroquinate synthase n=1 Tax=Halpernia frigidisoli TaxID=1125876 RepID=A0A1I3DKL9_9FLAO|nr:3-dehydroquinate synthase [Halpernia frigidisoli]SFH87078.1 3-dehydroquinate synthase [Halpernia frigidisoli]
MISLLDDDFSALNEFLTELKPSQLIILADENTHEYCLPQLLVNLETEIPFEIIEIEAGEDLKTIETATHLWEILAEFKTDRNALVINLGGGVITDVGGFVASTYKRGIKFINIPTTLLGMCDASIGGKTGIDHAFLKNIIGTFSQPEKIFFYPKFLKTLPFEELRSGFAEMLKHGLIADEKHWKDLISVTELSADHLEMHINKSMQIKQNVVDIDFKEQNVRKTLNFGHTFGHAFESLFLKKENAIPHGEAVAMGMICETYLSFLQKYISAETSDQIIAALQFYFPYQDISHFSNEEITLLMLNDKKNDSGKIKFSLLETVGKGNFDIEVSEENVIKTLDFYRKLS